MKWGRRRSDALGLQGPNAQTQTQKNQKNQTNDLEHAPQGAPAARRMAQGQRGKKRNIQSRSDTPYQSKDSLRTQGPQAILHPPITRTHPMNHGNQKNKTESWNRLEQAPMAPRCPPKASGQRPHKGQPARSPDGPSDDGTSRINRAEGTLSPPIPRMNPINQRTSKKQNRVMEGSRTAHTVRAPACPRGRWQALGTG